MGNCTTTFLPASKLFSPYKTGIAGLLFLLVCFAGKTSFGQTTTLAGVAVPVSSISPLLSYTSAPSVSFPVYNFSLVQTGAASNLSTVTFTTTGTYSATTDITSFTLYVNTIANSLVGSTAVTSGTLTAAGVGTQTMTLSTPYTLAASGVNAYYFFIVPTIGSGAVTGHTFAISSFSVTMSAGTVSGSAPVTGTQTIVNPTITASSGGSRCGTGSVTLNATPSAGGTINWYSASSGGTSLGTGTTFVTPSISSNTTYYAEVSQPATIQTGTLSDNTVALLGAYIYDQRSDLHWISTTNPITINSVDVYAYTAGNIILVLADNSGTILQTAATYYAAAGSATVPVTVPLNFSVAGGVSNYRVGGTGVQLPATDAQIYRGAITVYGPYPATGGGYSQSGDAAVGQAYTGLGQRCYFYNWNITTQAIKSTRTTVIATVNPIPTAITGTVTVCAGAATTTLNSTPAGGTWSSGSPAIGSIGSSTGVVTGLTPGTTTVTYNLNNGCATVNTVVTVNPLPVAGSITGTASVCPAATTGLSDGAGGGVWTSVTPANATINSTTGIVTGVAAGTTTISYTVTNGCGSVAATTVVTINPLPNAGSISGTAIVCPAATTSLSDVAPGGVWTSLSPGNATINSTSGLVTGVAFGTATISYTVTNICGTAAATTVVTINPLPNSGAITGTAFLCPGATTTLSDAVPGGTWSSVSPVIASIGTSGVVTGSNAGTTTISYSVTNSCGTAAATVVVTVNPLPNAGAISGTATVCPGATTTLSDGSAGGVWTSVIPARATVNSTSGVVTGVGAGTTTISYTVTNSCGTAGTSTIVTVNPLPTAGSISGTLTVCPGATTTLGHSGGAMPGGTWTSDAPSKASIDLFTGVVTGVAAGTAHITYSITNVCGTATSTAVVTVNPLPDAGTITGVPEVCPAATTLLADVSPGGVWTSVTPSKATIGSLSGNVTGVAAGTTTISYSVTNSCGTAVTTAVVTVDPLPSVNTITGSATVCPTATTTLSDATAGGNWTSVSPSTALIDIATGVVTGVAAGTTIISYAVTNSCGMVAATKLLTVNPLPNAGVISGLAVVCPTTITTLSDVAGGGVWTSAAPGTAIIGTASGMVSGVAVGTAIISYTVINSCGTAVATKLVTVNPLPNAGTITGASTVCLGATTHLSDVAAGGIWTSNAPATASIGSLSGIVTGVATGITTLSYSVTSSCATAVAIATITVNPLPVVPAAITGMPGICTGAATALSDITPGGIWGSSSLINAIVSSSGVVTGIAAGSATISYIISNSCGTNYSTFNITVNPLPVAGTITGASTVCAGAAITMSDAVPGGSWSSVSTGVATIDISGVVNGVASGTDLIHYSVTNVCGTATTSKIITVNPLPDAGSISGASSLCPGTVITLTDLTTGGIWSTGAPGIATVGSAGLVTGISAGTATISYSVTNMCGTAAATKNITTIPLPDAGTIAGSPIVCLGATISLTDASPGGVWLSTNSTATIAGGAVTGVTVGVDTIIYIVTNSCGIASTTKPIAILALPYAGAISGPTTVCTGHNITLTASGTGGGTWTASNANASVSGGLVTGHSAGYDMISYTVTNSCGTDIATYTVAVGNVNAGVITGSGSICVNDSIQLTDTITGGTWTRTNTTAFVSDSGKVFGVSPGVDTIVYIVTGACGSTAMALATVTVNPLAIADPVTGPGVVCQGAHITLNDAAAGGSWFSSNTAGATIDAAGYVTAILPGTVTISYVVTNSCGTDTARSSIQIDPLHPPVTGDTTVCPGAIIVLSANVSGGSWTSANSFIATVTNGTVTGVNTGSTIISYSVTNACGIVYGTRTVIVLPHSQCNTGVGSVTNGSNERMELFPNPTSGEFTIMGSLGTTTDETVSLEMRDMAGQVVYRKQFNAQNGIINEQLILGNTLANGMYLLNLAAGGQNTVFHIVVKR